MSRHRRIRAVLKGTSQCPRLSIFRSNRHVWLQLIDDESGKTLVSAGDLEMKGNKKTKTKITPESVGELLAKKAAEKNIKSAVFDRSGYRYHGIVKNVAEGARKAGLQI